MTEMIKSVDKNIKTVVLTVFHMFQKVEGDVSVVRRNMGDIKKK